MNSKSRIIAISLVLVLALTLCSCKRVVITEDEGVAVKEAAAENSSAPAEIPAAQTEITAQTVPAVQQAPADDTVKETAVQANAEEKAEVKTAVSEDAVAQSAASFLLTKQI